MAYITPRKMNWVAFAVLAGLALICQTTVASALAIQTITPSWMFVLAMFYALWGPWPDAAIAAWILGLLADLPASPIGLHAFTYGGAAWAVLRIRQVLFRDHALTQFILTFVFMLAIQVLVGLYLCWDAGRAVNWGGLGWRALLTAVYTAAWAPYMHWLFIRLERWTGIGPDATSTGTMR